MNVLTLLSSVVFTIGLSGVGCAFVLYPLLLSLTRLLRGGRPMVKGSVPLSVSLITIVRGSAGSARRKAENSLSLATPSEDFEVIMFWDGADDIESIRSVMPPDPHLTILASSLHKGKNAALNQAVEHSSGKVLVFSDADALLDHEALCQLVQPLADPSVGGVCGQLRIIKDGAALSQPQHTYWHFDRLMKTMESEIGSITSNTGVLYAVRRELFQPVPLTVTDDLYSCMNVVRQQKRFVLEPRAVACIAASSKTPKHELQRRRRIVCRSLRGIWLSREVLNPCRYGLFSLGLFLNKVLRRFLPVMLVVILASTTVLAIESSPMRWLWLIQVLFYASVVPAQKLVEQVGFGGITRRLVLLSFYFFLGMVGTWLGLMDFLKGEQIARWETPEAADPGKEGYR